MALSSRQLIPVGVGVVFLLFLFWIISTRRNDTATVANGGTNNVEELTPESLDHQIREALPVDTRLEAVQNFLANRGIEFSFETASRTLYATARKLRGSTTLSSQALTLKFHFDQSSRLTSIESKIVYTGT